MLGFNSFWVASVVPGGGEPAHTATMLESRVPILHGL